MTSYRRSWFWFQYPWVDMHVKSYKYSSPMASPWTPPLAPCPRVSHRFLSYIQSVELHPKIEQQRNSVYTVLMWFWCDFMWFYMIISGFDLDLHDLYMIFMICSFYLLSLIQLFWRCGRIFQMLTFSGLLTFFRRFRLPQFFTCSRFPDY